MPTAPSRSRKNKPPARPPSATPTGAAAAALRKYKEKRNFKTTPEPAGAPVAEAAPVRRFCVQKHAARRLHYDLRLELDGVLKSWAVTRGPSLDPTDKRLAVETEDHPLEYLTFEGVIPKGEYGAGSMIVWDEGTWVPAFDPDWGLQKGHIEFTLEGERLHGTWHLVRMKPRPREKNTNWLLIKAEDDHSDPDAAEDWAEAQETSILSGRTNKELENGGDIRADHAARAKVAGVRDRALDKVEGARKGILPPFVEPSLAQITDKAPVGEKWLHEIKFDGYRVMARIDGGKVRIFTRNGHDWTEKFAALAERLKALPVKAAMIDGEAVVEDEAGISSFVALQGALSEGRSERITLYAFDLVYLDGFDLTGVPLIERKHLLEDVLSVLPKGGGVRYSEHLDNDGEAMARHACRLGLEGIVSKRSDRPYKSGRSGGWLKKKCIDTQEAVIAGYVPSTTTSKAVGSLVLGVMEDATLVHVGRVGTGFTATIAHDLWALLDPIRRKDPPFATKVPPEAAKGVRWTEPTYVAEVEFRGWTGEGAVRQASFKGLLEDYDPATVQRQATKRDGAVEAPMPRFHLTHADRVLWPDTGLTKEGLAGFYAEIASYVLPHIAGRPLSLMRCPEGIARDCFYQKHAWAGMSAAVAKHTLGEDEALVIADLEGVGALVQASVLEIHPWGSRLESAEYPDRMILDLDPGEGTSGETLAGAALAVKAYVENAGLVPFLKTTGGKGFHVVVPLSPEAGWDAVKDFAHTVAADLARDDPDRFTANMNKDVRRGRVYVDYLRNTRGATAVAPYSTRARRGAPVSTPLAWEELSPALKSNHFTVENLPTRLRYLGVDPWAEIDAAARPLPALPDSQAKGQARKASGRRPGTKP